MDSQPTPLSLSKSPASMAVPALAFFATLLSIPPFIAHVKGRNLAAATLIFWVTIFNFFSFINALIWPTDDIGSWWNGAGLCDIEVKLQDAASVGGPGALACIFRQLAIILDTERTVLAPSRRQRRKTLALEIALCIAFPAWMFIAQYIVQTHRYYIFAIAGCNPVYDDSWLTIALIFIWPFVLSILDLYYCVMVVYRLILYRHQFSSILSTSSSTNRNRFVRLFAMAVTFLLIFLPVNIYVFARNLDFARQPFSWSAVHGPNWNEIIEVPTNGAVVFDRWVQIGVGLAVFCFFGFGRDATEMYRSWLTTCGLGRLLRSSRERDGSSGGKSSSGRFSTSVGSSFGERLGSVSSRARLFFHKHRRAQKSDSSETFRTGTGTDTLLPPLPLHTSTKKHITPAFGSNLEPPSLTSSPPPPPPAYRWSWLRGGQDRSIMTAADEEIRLTNMVFGGDGTKSQGQGLGSVETRIWSEKKNKKKGPGLEDMVRTEVAGMGKGKGEVRVVRKIVQV